MLAIIFSVGLGCSDDNGLQADTGPSLDAAVEAGVDSQVRDLSGDALFGCGPVTTRSGPVQGVNHDGKSCAFKGIMAYWARFARTGDPNGGSASSWPRYDETKDGHLELGIKIGVNPASAARGRTGAARSR